LAIIPAGIALNMVLGTVVSISKLPIYVDAVGTILVTLLVGWRAGVIVGVVSFSLMALFVNPIYIYFIGTQAIIALFIHLVAAKLSAFSNIWATVLTGICLGITAAIVSAPIIVIAFGGVSGSGRDLITAVFMNSGNQILDSVILSGIASEPFDKTIQVLLACTLIRTAPRQILDRFQSSAMIKNSFLSPKS